MISKTVILNNEVGLHARPAAIFVKEANKYLSDVEIRLKDNRVNGKSIIGVMSLGAFHGEEISLVVEGIDEKEASDKLSYLLEEGLKDL